MGMAASQARLLTITARLNHVELEAQMVSNAKIRLTDKTEQASDEYVAALSKTEYLYNYYDGSGEKVTMPLTGGALTTYGELKNQYGLINPAGQILVSERDAENYKNSNTLQEFLDKYGVLGKLGEGDKIQVINPAYTDAWDIYNDDIKTWQAQEPDPNDPAFFDTEIQVTGNNKLYNDFLATGGCLGGAIGGSNCYMHVLADAIGVGKHTTSSGQEFEVFDNISWSWNSALHSRTTFDPITQALKENYCSGDVIPGGTEEATINGSTVTVGGPASDPNMTLYQRAVDLLWEVHNDYDGSATGGTGSPENLQKFFYFVEHDLKQLAQEEVEVFNPERFNEAYGEWQNSKPQEPTVPEYIEQEVRKIEDLDQAQWYVNLWHRMNGTSDIKGGFNQGGNFVAEDDFASKSESTQNWAVLKDGDMNSPEYLKFAIENGLITIEQVQFTDPSDLSQGVENAAWTSIVFSNAQDITEQKNELAITKAEAKYNQALREIEAIDKELDIQLKQLDTEHNALQTEYDSIKGVIDKNVERTFKTFS